MKPVAIRKSRPVAIRKSRPVAVKKSMTQGYDSSGKPIMMFGGGGGGATPTYLSNILGGVGGVGGAVLGALGGHRDLGSLLQGIQSGSYTGRDLGRSAGKLTRVIPGARRRLAARGARQEADDTYRAERAKREASGAKGWGFDWRDYAPNLLTDKGRREELANWKDEDAMAQLYGKERARAMFYGEGGDRPSLDELESHYADAKKRHKDRTDSKKGTTSSQRDPLEEGERGPGLRQRAKELLVSGFNTAQNVAENAFARVLPVNSTNTGIGDQTDGGAMNERDTNHEGEYKENMYQRIDAMGPNNQGTASERLDTMRPNRGPPTDEEIARAKGDIDQGTLLG